jgi:hypothetical protein
VKQRQPLYVILMGAVLAAALALRIFDPAPVARMRLAVFDSMLTEPAHRRRNLPRPRPRHR